MPSTLAPLQAGPRLLRRPPLSPGLLSLHVCTVHEGTQDTFGECEGTGGTAHGRRRRQMRPRTSRVSLQYAAPLASMCAVPERSVKLTLHWEHRAAGCRRDLVLAQQSCSLRLGGRGEILWCHLVLDILVHCRGRPCCACASWRQVPDVILDRMPNAMLRSRTTTPRKTREGPRRLPGSRCVPECLFGDTSWRSHGQTLAARPNCTSPLHY